MKVEKNKKYRIKGESKYFGDKYGTPNPEIVIEDTDENVLGGSWMFANGNPAAMMYGMRSGFEGLPVTDVYYGKVGMLGELVHASELEELK